MGGCAARRVAKGTKPLIAGMVGHDPKMLELYASIWELAAADVPVLIQGESGTGKELVATAIHRGSHRAAKRFVAVNCGAIPDSLVETELFGHVKGAFTGARRDRMGRFELADGGTILLDEVGDLSHAAQVKLLRVLQDGTFEKVGAERQSSVDVRVISATNKDLRREVAANRFREDLFYRLSVVPLSVPPLRERLADIPLLVEHILDTEDCRSDRSQSPARPPRLVTVARETLALLLAHRWPGNIRELQNIVRYALIKCKGEILRPEHLPPSFTAAGPDNFKVKGRKPKISADSAATALAQAGGSPTKAARSLGVSRTTLYRHLQKSEESGEAAPFQNILPAIYGPACRSHNSFRILEQRHSVDEAPFKLEATGAQAQRPQRSTGMVMVPPADIPTGGRFAVLKAPQGR